MDRNNRNKAYPNETRYERNQLAYLHDLGDWKVHHDDPDVRGWKVVTDSGETVGKVDNLVVSPAQRRVRYLDVDLADNIVDRIKSGTTNQVATNTATRPTTSFNTDNNDRHILMPIGLARLDRSTKEVRIAAVNTYSYGTGPRHRKGTTLTPSYEAETVNHYDRNYTNRSGEYDSTSYRPDRYKEHTYMTDDAFYDNEYFQDDRFYGREATSRRTEYHDTNR